MQPHCHDIISRHQPGPCCYALTMEPTDNNNNDNKSAAAELQTSVLQLPKHLAASFLCCIWPPLQPIPCYPLKSCPCGGSKLWSQQPTSTVSSVPKFWITFHSSRELLWPQTCFWASILSCLPLPSSALFPYPTSRLSIWPVHPQPPPEWPCALPSLLQLWRLQLPSRALLSQFSVANRETDVQTRIWSSTAILLKALLVLSIDSSSQFFPSVLFQTPNSSLLTLILSPPVIFLPFLHSLFLPPILPDSRGFLLYLSLLHYFSLSLIINLSIS